MAYKERKQLGQLLIDAGLITLEQLAIGLKEQNRTGDRLGRCLINLGFVTEKDMFDALAGQLGLKYVKLSELEIDKGLIAKVPANSVCRHNIFPIKEENGVLTVAIADPLDIYTLDDIRLLLGYEIEVVISNQQEIESAIKKYYGIGAETMQQMVSTQRLDTEEEVMPKQELDLADMSTEASVIKFVNQIILEAYHSRATDIHFEPFENDLCIRYRIDGVLHKTSVPPEIVRFQPSIVSRIKIMAELDIAEKRLPQDGRIKVKISGEELDMRVSVIPTLFGESVNIRLLSKSNLLIGLEELGLPALAKEEMVSLVQRPHGIILVTGPTGSGKTTTLYAVLNKLNFSEKKIITIEDPVEYQLKGVNQMQVKPHIELTFARGLRSILRQDPDVIMVGEIRDLETAEIAIRAALTGHLVLSTLHTNDAAGGITRLIDMGIEPFLVASSLEAILAQRLLRLLCPKCKEVYIPDKGYLSKIGLEFDNDQSLYRPKGCDYCRQTGYLGRSGIFEILKATEAIRKMVVEKVSADRIRQEAVSEGMQTLRQAGWEKVKKGLTSIEELIRVTEEG